MTLIKRCALALSAFLVLFGVAGVGSVGGGDPYPAPQITPFPTARR